MPVRRRRPLSRLIVSSLAAVAVAASTAGLGASALAATVDTVAAVDSSTGGVTALPDVLYDNFYDVRLAVGADPDATLTITSGALPPGLDLVGDLVTGQPRQVGTFTFEVTATSAGASTTRAFSLLVEKNFIDIDVDANTPYGFEGIDYSLSNNRAEIGRGQASSLPGARLTGVLRCTDALVRTADGPRHVGTYPVDTASCSGLAPVDPGSFRIRYNNARLRIFQAIVTVRPSGTQTFGGAPTFTYTPTFNQGNLPLQGSITCSQLFNGSGRPRLPISPALPVGTYTLIDCTGVFVPGALEEDVVVLQSTAVGGFTVTKAPVTATINGTQTYGGSGRSFTTAPVTGPAVAGTPTCTRLVGGRAIDDTLPAGTYRIDGTSCAGPALANTSDEASYTLGLAGGDYVVAPKELTVTASSGSSTFGSAPGTVSPSYDGFVGTDGPGSLDVRPSCSTTATAASNAGTYPSTCSGGQDGDYSLRYVPGTWTVNRTAVTVTTSATSGLVNLLTLRTSFRATVVGAGSGVPITGSTVTFTFDRGRTACSAVTDARGVATCSSTWGTFALGAGYSVSSSATQNATAGSAAGSVPTF